VFRANVKSSPLPSPVDFFDFVVHSVHLSLQKARNMPLVITPEVGIPLPFDVTPEEVVEFRDRAKAACATILELIEAGAEVPEPTEEDSLQAHVLFAAERPIKVAKTPPPVILKLEALLTSYDHEFLDAQRRIAKADHQYASSAHEVRVCFLFVASVVFGEIPG
jgi:hypothetical protein